MRRLLRTAALFASLGLLVFFTVAAWPGADRRPRRP